MRNVVTVGLVVGIMVATVTFVSATKVALPLELKDVTGEWVGQSGFVIFRLDLNGDGTGTLRYVEPSYSPDIFTVYQITELQFDGYEIRITLNHAEWGSIVLTGRAWKQKLDLRIKGLYRRTKPQLPLIRATAWNSALDRLRVAMKE